MSTTQTALDALTEWQISRATGNPDLEHEKATAMLKAVKQAITANTWRDIKDAPRDGNPVLGYVKSSIDEWHDVVRWTGENHGWFSGISKVNPTHWQPLPPKPEQPPC